MRSGATGRRSKRATLRDVAERAGVSDATVSRILNGTYAAPPSTEARVMKAVDELGYVINAHARALASSSAGTIGIVTWSLTSPFSMYVASGIEEQAKAMGRACLIMTTDDNPDQEWEAVTLLRQQGAEAVILVGGALREEHHNEKLAAAARSMRESGAQLVLCNHPPLDTDAPVIEVTYDNEGGSFAATNYVLSAGHTRVAYLGGSVTHSFHAGRIGGYRKALEQHGIAFDPALVGQSSLARRDVMNRTKELIRADLGVTAIFASNDHVAHAALLALREMELSVPDDLSLIGYYDSPPAADLTPALTTVHVPQVELGRTAARLAFDEEAIAEGRRVVLGTTIIVRDSVAPPRR